MKPIHLIGMGTGPKDLTRYHRELIKQADVLVGGQRLLDGFEDPACERLPITRNLSGLLEEIRERMKTESVVILASGDPLFYGIGAYLLKNIDPDYVTIHPNINMVSAAFARIKMPWQNARVVSLHGRQDEEDLRNACYTEDTIAVFTDPERHPGWLANWMREKGLTCFDLCVLEKMGEPEETIRWFAVEEAVGKEFADPNLTVLIRKAVTDAGEGSQKYVVPFSGMPDEAFEHEAGMITKSEIRVISVAKLKPETQHVMWDLGAGCGSVSIEASLFLNGGQIFAVEKNPVRAGQIRENICRFRVGNITVVEDVLPEAIDNLPDPDRIFVGGGGSHLESILARCIERLKADGIIVVNTVLLDNLNKGANALENAGFSVETIQVQINRVKPMPWSKRLDALNPVWVITGRKE